MYSRALLLVYPGILTLSERLILKHYYDFSVLTFSEQPLSGLLMVSMVNEHLLKSGHWRQMMKTTKLVLKYSAINVMSKVWGTLPNTLITSERQRWWSSQHTSKHSRTSLAYILMDWTLHCFALNWPLLTCSALWKRTPRILVHRESSGRSKALHPGWNFAAHNLVVIVEQEAMLNRPKLWS